jgi:hypothetical protein
MRANLRHAAFFAHLTAPLGEGSDLLKSFSLSVPIMLCLQSYSAYAQRCNPYENPAVKSCDDRTLECINQREPNHPYRCLWQRHVCYVQTGCVNSEPNRLSCNPYVNNAAKVCYDFKENASSFGYIHDTEDFVQCLTDFGIDLKTCS